MLYRAEHWRNFIRSQAGETALLGLYQGEGDGQRERYLDALARFAALYGDRPAALFSAPGRTELCGNHTDHQRGRVLAAAVTVDIIAVAAPNDGGVIRLYSEGFGSVGEVDLQQLLPRTEEQNQTVSLVRGVTARLRELGYEAGGFDAYVTSDIPHGSGLSSSAAFEVLVGTIHNHLFNGGTISPLTVAQIGQYAENVYFGKPSGLLDQASSSVGGIVHIDFCDKEHPVVERLEPPAWDYELCIVGTGGSHADLTGEYAEIPREMKAVAEHFGYAVLREVDAAAFYAQLPELRKAVPDRAILRAMHFFEENERVVAQVSAMRQCRWEDYRNTMIASGRSSFMALQNVYPTCSVQERGNALALALSGQLLDGVGAWRIHGGGFAGTIQALVPHTHMDDYRRCMERLFGAENFFRLSVRAVGGHKL